MRKGTPNSEVEKKEIITAQKCVSLERETEECMWERLGDENSRKGEILGIYMINTG